MKIRTDFVTNSSSSSFTVNLNMELKNGTSLVIDSEDWSGDYESKCLHIRAEDANKSKLFEEAVVFEENDDFFYYDVSHFVGDIQFGHLNLAEVLSCEDISEGTKKIEQAFITLSSVDDMQEDLDEYEDEDFEEEEEGLEQYDEDTQEAILEAKAKIEKIADFVHTFFHENVTDKDDIQEMSLSMEFGGRGEFLAGPEEILDKIFGWRNSDVWDILEEQEDEETTLENLKALSCTKGMSEQAILELIHFWKECDYTPGMCNIGQELEDGEIRFSISVDEDCW